MACGEGRNGEVGRIRAKLGRRERDMCAHYKVLRMSRVDGELEAVKAVFVFSAHR